MAKQCMKWISVEDELPKDEQRVLLWVRHSADVGHTGQMRMGAYRFGKLMHDGSAGDWHRFYSHWQPLPSPPEDSKPASE